MEPGRSPANLYLAIGGSPSVELIVDDLYERLSDDPLVKHHFHADRLTTLKTAQCAWFTAVLSGEQELPADLGSAQAHLVTTNAEVSALLGHLETILAQTTLSPRLQYSVMSLVRRLWYARKFN
jgi:truncated hemoglobin YjbI